MEETKKERTTYRAVVLANTLKKSKDKQTPSVNIKLRAKFDVLQPNIPVEYTMWGDLWLTFKTVKNTMKTLQEVFGWKGHYIEDFNQPILEGKECELVVEESEWNGKPTFDILFFNRVGGLKSMEADDLQNLINEVQPMINEELGIEEEDAVAEESQVSAMDESGEEIVVEPVVEDDLPF